MAIPTEPIGSIPRPQALLTAIASWESGATTAADLAAAYDNAVRDTIRRLEEAGLAGRDRRRAGQAELRHLPDRGACGPGPRRRCHPVRRRPPAAASPADRRPFRYQAKAASYLQAAQRFAAVPVKQAVIAPSALSLFYPADGIDGYPRDAFIADLVNEAEADIRGALDAGAHIVQLDFTEGRLSLKLDPSGGVLASFIELNNQVLDRFTAAERARIGVHTCPGGDQDSTHSLDVDYAGLLPQLFQLKAGSFYLQLASEPEPEKVLAIVAEYLPADARAFIGVTDPIDPQVETPEQVADRVLTAARQLPADRLGTCDDCGFAPFADDMSTSRETAFAKVSARVAGTALAAEQLGL